MNKIILFLLPFLIITHAHSVHIINQTNVTLELTNFVRTNGVVITGKKDLEPKKSFIIKDILSFTIKSPMIQDYYPVTVTDNNTCLIVSEIEGRLTIESAKLIKIRFVNQTIHIANITNIIREGGLTESDTFTAKPSELLKLENVKSFTIKVGTCEKNFNLQEDTYVSITEESNQISIKCIDTNTST